MSDNPNFDQSLVDRFVDGELTDAEERELLGRLDDEPGGWRALALGFVESRTLRREFEDLLREPVLVSPPPERSTARTARWSRVVLAVALLLAGFGFGMLLKSPDKGLDRERTAEDDQVDPSGVDGPGLAPSDEAVPESMVLFVPDGEKVRPVSVPLVRDTEFVSTGVPAPVEQVFDDLRRGVIASGHAIEEAEIVYRLSLDDRYDVLVPVREVEISPRDVDWVQ